ncbi:hypothetical protein [Pelosinus sp. UFO1]|uniref:hypothetical protein n=1 Tax=Pelosinus sp. UFO1 TaxID=484770 RepID=UPI0004D0ED9B|nr:hypothetical protein [Pelosinus sp. UFO1]AIF51255.1 hypothetical protein UFO1_1704 [Pelosinus sp. UFO1]
MSEESLKEPNKEPDKTASNVDSSLIYLGPNLPSMLNRFTVYKGGMPKHLDKMVTDCPEIESMFVPVAKLSEVMGKINQTGTPYNVWYNAIIEFIKKGVK